MEFQLDEILPTGPLFKFLSLADGQSPDWKIRVTQLLNGHAYLPSPSQFNDPFDCVPHVAFPDSLEEYYATRDVLLPKFLRALPELSERVIDETLIEAFSKAESGQMLALAAASFSDSAKRMGVFCLAECIQSVLMWSHYASNHTGVALRFDWRRQLRGGLMPMFKVRYSMARPEVMKDRDDDLSQAAIIDALRTKAQFWEYEQEWRFIQPEGAGTIVEFNPTVVDGVILGANCSESNEAWIRNEIGARNVAVMRVFPAKDTFELRFAQRET